MKNHQQNHAEKSAAHSGLIPNTNVAALDRTIRLSEPNFLLMARRSNVTISVFNAEDVPTFLQASYSILGHAAVAKHPALLKCINPEEVFTTDTVIAFVEREGILELGMYATREQSEVGPYLDCKGLVSGERLKGVVPALISATFAGDAHWSGEFSSGEAVARIMPNNEVNVGSSLNFCRLEFYSAQSYVEQIDLKNIHRAIQGSVEPDGTSTRALLMRGKAKDIEPRAREILKSWDLAYGKTRAGFGLIAAKEPGDE